jgi:aminopeptidase N
MMFKKLSVLALIAIALSCHKTEPRNQAPASPAANSGQTPRGLTQMAAADRAKLLSNVTYDLSFSLSAHEKDFTGTAAIAFDLAATKEPVTVDFTGGTVLALEVNGRTFEPKYNGSYLELPAASLKAGPNDVLISFSHPYSVNGMGLYRFEDPEDKRVYLYTDFEPYNANLLWPCFDQPDLKARFTLKVETPTDWLVVSAARESAVAEDGGRKTWAFPRTEPISTYVFSLHAGPYHVWEDKTEDGIPLRLLARESLARYVEHDEWLTITKQGLKFYQDYFAFPYPFGKYDQVIVPDFNAGAMENVAAVTHSERMVFRGKPDRDERLDRADTILHEMAHMWFGNLVTMKWWNGLWLNESFASFMAPLAMTRATEFKEAWLSFNVAMKSAALFEDRLVTTHPVETPVLNTSQSFANFDGITYGKGASVLKQLAFALGEDKFRDGVRAYFKKHAFRNAELRDFIGALAEASGADLKSWTGSWLSQAGVNSASPEYACDGGAIATFFVKQRAPHETPTLRAHHALAGLYGEDGGFLKLTDSVPIAYAGAKTAIPALVGKPCPAFVNLNQDDSDYAVSDLSAADIKALRGRISRLPDALTRLQTWQALWDAVRDGALPTQDYAGLMIEELPFETDFTVANSVMATVSGANGGRASVLRYLPDEKNLSPSTRMAYTLKFEEFLLERLKAADAGSDFQKMWYDHYVLIARSPASQTRLTDFLSGKTPYPGLVIDQDRRWVLVVKLNSFAPEGRPNLVAEELKGDASDSGHKMAISAEAIRPDPAVKASWFEKITAAHPKESLAELTAAMGALFPLSQTGLAEPFIEKYFSVLPGLAETKDDEFLESFTEELTPDACGKITLAPLHQFIQKHQNLTAIALKNLKIARQEQARCAKVRALARDKAKRAAAAEPGVH